MVQRKVSRNGRTCSSASSSWRNLSASAGNCADSNEQDLKIGKVNAEHLVSSIGRRVTTESAVSASRLVR